jgi:asparagine synthase (glutamine-hydrolysing)
LLHLVDAHQSGQRDYSAPLWSLLMFEAFLKRHENEVTAESPTRVAATG